jgi:putative endonuclease
MTLNAWGAARLRQPRHSRAGGNPFLRGNERKLFFVYILASGKNGTLYIGVTSDLVGRTYTHRNDLIEGFSRRYGVHDLVWFEQHPTAETAITREKQLKKWNRAWKVRLIEEANPHWLDRYEKLAKHWG